MNNHHFISLCTLSLLMSLSLTLEAKPKKTPTWTDPIIALKEHAGFKYQGEYVQNNAALQVVPAEGKFYVAHYQGGLPGAGWNNKDVKYQWLTKIELESLLVGFTRIDRGVKSSQYPAPKEATIVFDGKRSAALQGGKIVNGLLMAGVKTSQHHQDFTLHMEFRTPYKPELSIGNPDRGNSGIYLLGMYEIQIMDCFSLTMDESKWKKQEIVKYPNGCNGSIYRFKKPDINMSFPSLTWQSYDIDFTAPRFKEGIKTSNARITVHHNGVKIHNDIEILKGTGNKGRLPEVATGPIYFQNHHNPVQFRNIWMVKT